MTTKNWLLAAVEAVIWYFFTYYFLYVINNPGNLAVDAFVLLALAYAGTITCPWFRNTGAWKSLFNKSAEQK